MDNFTDLEQRVLKAEQDALKTVDAFLRESADTSQWRPIEPPRLRTVGPPPPIIKFKRTVPPNRKFKC